MKIFEFLLGPAKEPTHLEALQSHFGDSAKIKSFNAENGEVIVETDKSLSDIELKLKSVFSDTRLIGQSSTNNANSAAVAIIGGSGGVKGIVRLIEDEFICSAEGTIEGLTKGRYKVSVNEYGDISNSCFSTGAPISKPGDSEPAGIIGEIYNDGSAETRFYLQSDKLSIQDCIGRSLVLQSLESKVACGIIGRSAGVFENRKKICACDGKVIWEEQVFGPYAVAPSYD